jgi:hypothetical protein
MTFPSQRGTRQAVPGGRAALPAGRSPNRLAKRFVKHASAWMGRQGPVPKLLRSAAHAPRPAGAGDPESNASSCSECARASGVDIAIQPANGEEGVSPRKAGGPEAPPLVAGGTRLESCPPAAPTAPRRTRNGPWPHGPPGERPDAPVGSLTDRPGPAGDRSSAPGPARTDRAHVSPENRRYSWSRGRAAPGRQRPNTHGRGGAVVCRGARRRDATRERGPADHRDAAVSGPERGDVRARRRPLAGRLSTRPDASRRSTRGQARVPVLKCGNRRPASPAASAAQHTHIGTTVRPLARRFDHVP